jgi:Asp-tRNA(Asn)/Glu-tRNA(Gln) amidotransferase A subunit family amidase
MARPAVAGTAEIIEAGRDIPAWRYIDALHEKAAYTRTWAGFFEHLDLLLTPTMQLTAFPVGQPTPESIEARRSIRSSTTGAPAACPRTWRACRPPPYRPVSATTGYPSDFRSWGRPGPTP